MSMMISFDRVAEAKSILKAGINRTSIHAKDELRTAAWYLVNKTTYSRSQIERRLRTVAEGYFRGLPEDYVSSCIQDVISCTDKEQTFDTKVDRRPSITIYKEELGKIAELGHDDTERLAFVFLCVAKMIPYEQIYECNSKLYRLAWRYKYDTNSKRVLEKQDTRRVGGNEPTKRVHRLCQLGIVSYSTRIHSTYSRSKDRPTASAMFSVPIIQRDGDVAFVIEDPDEDSLVLYYDRYKGYGGIVTCAQCGKPVLRTGRRHKYCASCADIVKHGKKKRNLCEK